MTFKIGENTYDDLDAFMAEDAAARAAMNPFSRWIRDRGVYGYNLRHWMKNPHKLVKLLKSEVQWKVQRAQTGYALSDTWSLDGYLLGWLPDAVKDLREGTHGYPMSLHNDLGHVLENGYEPTKAQSDAAFDHWKNILTTIETGLRTGASIQDDYSLSSDEYERKRKEFYKAWKLMGKHLFAMWN